MDATLTPTIPRTRESDQPMSVEIIRELLEANATSIDELSILLGGLSKSGTYRYAGETELRFGQLMMIFCGAKG